MFARGHRRIMTDQCTSPDPGPKKDARFARAALGCVAGGALAGLGQEPFTLWPIAVFGFSLGFLGILRAADFKSAFVRGFAFGFFHFVVTLLWLKEPFLVEGGAASWFAPFAVILMSGAIALNWATASALTALVPGAGARILVLPFMLFLAERVRSAAPFGGFEWGAPGLMWIDTPAAQIASILGVSGLSWMTFSAAALVVALVLRQARPVHFGAVLLGALALLAPGGDQETAFSDTLVRIVQPNAAQEKKWDPDWAPRYLERSIAFSTAPGDPDLVIWPETAAPFDLGVFPEIEAEIADRISPAYLLTGIQREVEAGKANSLVLFDRDGVPAWVHDKTHLVPFMEYHPLKGLLGALGVYRILGAGGEDMARGQGGQLRDLPDGMGSVLPLICYEAVFSRNLREVDGRADMIVHVTNDAWFGTFSGPQQHLAQVRFRAIETGLPVLRAANTGISAVISPSGKILDALDLGESGFLDARIPEPGAPTLYAARGDAPLTWLSLFVYFAISTIARRATRSRAAGSA